jgi:hypothetical protein
MAKPYQSLTTKYDSHERKPLDRPALLDIGTNRARQFSFG